ncbi:hypothetical protein M758_1G277200 [Ceratodon purpureus]|uniref:Uncharacterized protein n=1 Tax=Ceratodon purpureus TaxID=3225 RepID=A0A8T0JD95_CERPU|nr:hypothetical protein KC19_1G285600 [Ceratodon purpureus]KAG0631755.1 hypothetical protein M758_1G277200 [Ceratodon purpureus]
MWLWVGCHLLLAILVTPEMVTSSFVKNSQADRTLSGTFICCRLCVKLTLLSG